MEMAFPTNFANQEELILTRFYSWVSEFLFLIPHSPTYVKIYLHVREVKSNKLNSLTGPTHQSGPLRLQGQTELKQTLPFGFVTKISAFFGIMELPSLIISITNDTR